jgi:hypothetical protein
VTRLETCNPTDPEGPPSTPNELACGLARARLRAMASGALGTEHVAQGAPVGGHN